MGYGLEVLILLVACQAPEPAEPGPKDTGEVSEETRPPAEILLTEPVWTAVELEQVLQEQLAPGLAEPVSLRNWLLGTVERFTLEHEGESAECALELVQVHEEDTLASFYNGTCESLDGLVLDGGWILSESWVLSEDTEIWQMNLLTGLEVGQADGRVARSGGQVDMKLRRVGSALEYSYAFGGDYELGLDRGWMSETTGGGLYVEGTRRPLGLVATLDGGLRRGDMVVFFDELQHDPAVCEGFTGAVEVRDPSTAWLRWELDCGTCGPLLFGDEVLGEVCAGEALFDALEQAVSSIGGVQPW